MSNAGDQTAHDIAQQFPGLSPCLADRLLNILIPAKETPRGATATGMVLRRPGSATAASGSQPDTGRRSAAVAS